MQGEKELSERETWLTFDAGIWRGSWPRHDNEKVGGNTKVVSVSHISGEGTATVQRAMSNCGQHEELGEGRAGTPLPEWCHRPGKLGRMGGHGLFFAAQAELGLDIDG